MTAWRTSHVIPAIRSCRRRANQRTTFQFYPCDPLVTSRTPRWPNFLSHAARCKNYQRSWTLSRLVPPQRLSIASPRRLSLISRLLSRVVTFLKNWFSINRDCMNLSLSPKSSSTSSMYSLMSCTALFHLSLLSFFSWRYSSITRYLLNKLKYISIIQHLLQSLNLHRQFWISLWLKNLNMWFQDHNGLHWIL